MLALNAFDTAYCRRRIPAAGCTDFKGDSSRLRDVNREWPWAYYERDRPRCSITDGVNSGVAWAAA